MWVVVVAWWVLVGWSAAALLAVALALLPMAVLARIVAEQPGLVVLCDVAYLIHHFVADVSFVTHHFCQ